jgi:hypothetical protein
MSAQSPPKAPATTPEPTMPIDVSAEELAFAMSHPPDEALDLVRAVRRQKQRELQHTLHSLCHDLTALTQWEPKVIEAWAAKYKLSIPFDLDGLVDLILAEMSESAKLLVHLEGDNSVAVEVGLPADVQVKPVDSVGRR